MTATVAAAAAAAQPAVAVGRGFGQCWFGVEIVHVAAPRAQGVEVAGGIDGGGGASTAGGVGSSEQAHHFVFGGHRASPIGAAGTVEGRDCRASYSRARLRRARCSRCLAALGSIPSTAAMLDADSCSQASRRSTSASVSPRRAAQPGRGGTRPRRAPTSSAAEPRPSRRIESSRDPSRCRRNALRHWCPITR